MATIASVQAHVFRWPVEVPVVTSFGTMRDRPALLVRVEDSDGVIGWGESWCNFPSVGAEHRARLVDSVLGPALAGSSVADPESGFRELSRRTAVLALQSGEPGPFAQAIAGIDIALWDLAARRAGLPLWQLLGGRAGVALPRVLAYASGINPDGAADTLLRQRAAGYRAFKLKVGFGAERDRANVSALAGLLQPGERLCVDANQGWSLPEAIERVTALREFPLEWIEEPLRADSPWSEWRAVKQAAAAPLAAGENLGSQAAFDDALVQGALGIVQPDVAKWGGLTGCRHVARAVRAAGRRYCPHYLGAGVGLLASAHLLAAVGGDGWLEVDSNPNPLRERLCPILASLRDGELTLPVGPGLGVEPDLQELAELRVPH